MDNNDNKSSILQSILNDNNDNKSNILQSILNENNDNKSNIQLINIPPT